MKKVLVYVLAAIISIGMLSCKGEQEKSDEKDEKIEEKSEKSEKKSESLEDLKSKYDGKEFKNCDEFLKAADEIIDVFVTIINNAADGDDVAMTDIDRMEIFMGQFDNQAEMFEKDCPQKFNEFSMRTEEKMEDAVEKLMELLIGDMDWDYDEDLDF